MEKIGLHFFLAERREGGERRGEKELNQMLPSVFQSLYSTCRQRGKEQTGEITGGATQSPLNGLKYI